MLTPRRVAISLELHLLHKHHTDLFAGVQQFFAETRWQAVVDNWPEETLRRSPPGQPAYDGFIARVTPERMELVDLAAKTGLPLVNVLVGSPAFDRLPGVFPDFAAVGRLQAQHLLDRGARHLGFLNIAKRRPDEMQFEGFRIAAEAAGHAVSRCSLPERWDEVRSRYRMSVDRIQKWMDTWGTPMGVAAGNDFEARAIAQLCNERHWKVPESVLVVGARNEEHFCEGIRPELSSVEIGYQRVGYEAGRLLARLFHERETGKVAGAMPAHVCLEPVGVIPRQSTEWRASDDAIVAEAQRFIRAGYGTAITVEDVAEAVMVSTKTLQKHFARSLGRTVADEISRVRLEAVKRQLAETDLPVKVVAKRNGYTSNARLCDVFRREVGMTPSDYRLAHAQARKA